MGLSERIDIILYRTVLNGPELRSSVSLALRQIWSVYVCDGLGFCLQVTFLPHTLHSSDLFRLTMSVIFRLCRKGIVSVV